MASNLKFQSTEELLVLDYQLSCVSQIKPNEPSKATSLYRVLAQVPNARQAQILSQTSPELVLPAIRAAQLRGDLKEAEKLIQQFETAHSSDLAKTESLLEQARLAAFNGEWHKCFELCCDGLRLSPPLITLVSLLQVRAVAYFELGEFLLSLRDIENVETYSTMVPNAVGVSFSRILKTKVLARVEGVQKARRHIQRLWDSIDTTAVLNLDNLVALMRAEVDLNRISNEPSAMQAVACASVAHKLGDRLYLGLAILDLYFSVPLDSREEIMPILAPYVEEYPRIQNILKEIKSENDNDFLSTTAKSFTAKDNNKIAIDFSRINNLIEKTSLIVLPRYSCFINLGASSIKKGQHLASSLQTVKALSQRDIGKDKLLNIIYGVKNYSADLHDATIRTLIHRTRKKIGVEITSKNGRLSLEAGTIVA